MILCIKLVNYYDELFSFISSFQNRDVGFPITSSQISYLRSVITAWP